MRRSQIAIVVLFLFLFYPLRSVYAGSFADAFRNFVLGSEAEAYSVKTTPALDLDNVSQECIDCHNGGTASYIELKDADAPYEIRGHQTLNHPVGMSYDQYALRDPAGFTPRRMLNRNLRLVDGKVTCITCHRLQSEARMAAMPVRAATLGSSGSCTASRELTVGPNVDDLCWSCHPGK